MARHCTAVVILCSLIGVVDASRKSLASAEDAVSDKAESAKVSANEWKFVSLLNNLRRKGFTCPKGNRYGPNKNALKFDCRLWRASYKHSIDMARRGYFSHTSKDGRSPWTRAKSEGLDAHGENIAAGGSSPESTLQQWKNSDGHCKNMGKKEFKLFAVGYGAGGPYRHYWTQMFSLKSSSPDTSCYPSGAVLADFAHGDGERDEAEDGDLPTVVGEPWMDHEAALDGEEVVQSAARTPPSVLGTVAVGPE